MTSNADLIITNAIIVNEGKQWKGYVALTGERIAYCGSGSPSTEQLGAAKEVLNAEGYWLIPGAIDDQVHFREPGLTHKGEIYSEAKAAVAGGVTSYMEMPNTVPSATNAKLLESKYQRASEVSLANYSFYMGTTNTNTDDVLGLDYSKVCGVKIFLGSSTGDMLVNDEHTLNRLFSECKAIIALHCEDDPYIKKQLQLAKAQFGEAIPMDWHSRIRNAEACYRSSAKAVERATKYGTRIHVLHISTARETSLFSNRVPLESKKITSEACIHHLWFSQEDYAAKGGLIKWNPAIKSFEDREGIWQALLDNRIDVVATDHAPHTWEEKQNPYVSCPSGGPLVQHSVLAMVDFVKMGKIRIENVVEKMCHAPAKLFKLRERGFIRAGYFADLVLINPNASTLVNKAQLLYKAKWSPFEGHTFQSAIHTTWVNGHAVYKQGVFDERKKGQRLNFQYP